MSEARSTGTGVCVKHLRGVCSPFYKNNFIAYYKSGVQHQKVRVKAEAPPHCVLCPHLDSRWLSCLMQALVLGLVTQNVFISVLPPCSCVIEAHTSARVREREGVGETPLWVCQWGTW